MNIWNDEKLIDVLSEGGVAVMPTDTIYGIVGQALNMFTVERIYNIRRRDEKKPCIVLVSDVGELSKFSIIPTPEQGKTLKEYWPGEVSIVFDCPGENFSYLHRGTDTLAFRLPKDEDLQNLLKKVGPLVAPSANLTDLPPAKNITEAKNYFGDLVGLYIDGGEMVGKPSKLIKLQKDGMVTIIRR